MTVQVFKNAFVRIGTSASPSTRFWTFARTVTVGFRQETLDKTAMGSSGRRRTFGLRDASVSIEWVVDYSTAAGSTGSIDKVLYNLIGVESSNCFINIRATTGALGASNPEYRGRFVLESYNPVSGNVADLSVITSNFVSAGKFVRAIA